MRRKASLLRSALGLALAIQCIPVAWSQATMAPAVATEGRPQATVAPASTAAALDARPQTAVASTSPPLAPTRLTRYTARYQVSYRGITGGQLEQALHPGSTAGQWVYESRAYPNLLGRIAVSPDARQRSTMELTATGVRPLTLVFDDGSDTSAKDVNIVFDWTTGRVHGQAKEKTFDYPVAAGTQDSASVQAAMINELVAGREPKSFWILNGAKLQEFRYWPEGHATVVTPYGQFDTVVWASQHPGSNRLNRVWHAPQLGYVPVQAIQYNKGRPDVQLKLVTLQRQGLSPQGTVP